MNVVYVPCKDKSEAREIAKKLVEQKLAICVNIIDRIESIYRWKGKVKESHESLLIIKTTQNLVDKVIKQIKKLHSYGLPDIISWKIGEVNSKILNWVSDELKV